MFSGVDLNPFALTVQVAAQDVKHAAKLSKSEKRDKEVENEAKSRLGMESSCKVITIKLSLEDLAHVVRAQSYDSRV